MRKVNLGMMFLCLFLAVALLAMFVYGVVALRQVDFVVLVYVVGAVLTARVFWKRAKLVGERADLSAALDTHREFERKPSDD